MPILAKEFSVSVAAIREVLRVLQSQNRISFEQGRGMFVNKDLMNIVNSELAQSRSSSLSIMNLMNLIEVRRVLEPTATVN